MENKCIHCKRNIDDEEFDEKGISCDDCELYLCDNCAHDDNILNKFFVYYPYGDYCIIFAFLL
jgi:uncharacterized protein YlaI